MRNKFHFSLRFFLALAAVVFLSAGCGCGGDDDDDDSGPPADDTGGDDAADDTGATDDVVDDTADDTAADDTGADDTFTDDDVDTEYPDLHCALADDPEGILPNLMGGGPIGASVTVYVFDDLTCEPISGASVYLNDDSAGVTTNADGMATLNLPDRGAQMVTAMKFDGAGGEPDYWAWSYKADASALYFRLKPYQTAFSYSDSDQGVFKLNGTAIDAVNPMNLIDLFQMPVTIGFSLPGFGRSGAIADLFLMAGDDYLFTMENIVAQDTFAMDIDFGTPLSYYLYGNMYLPEVALGIGAYSFSTEDHPFYYIPVETSAAVTPVEGFVMELDATKVFTGWQELVDLIDCIGAGDPMACVGEYIIPVINEALQFKYVGANVAWEGAGGPDIDALDTSARATFDVTLTAPDASLDYIALAVAEIPNRALLPMSLGVYDGGAIAMDYADVPDADYIILAGATDMISSGFEYNNFSFATRFTNSVHGFETGVTFDASDFLPMFDTGATSYDHDTGIITWALEEATDRVDVYLIGFGPSNLGPDTLAVVPGDQATYMVPEALLPEGPHQNDQILIVGLDLPDGVDPDGFNPSQILTYNFKAANVWTNASLLSMFLPSL
jgi:hypothetical protein